MKLIEFIIYTWNGIGLPSSPCIKWCFSSSWTNSLGWSRFSLSLTQPEIVYFSWIIQWGLGVKFFSWKKNVYLLVRIHLCWKLQCYSWSFHAKDLDQRCQKQFVHCFSFYCKSKKKINKSSYNSVKMKANVQKMNSKFLTEIQMLWLFYGTFSFYPDLTYPKRILEVGWRKLQESLLVLKTILFREIEN